MNFNLLSKKNILLFFISIVSLAIVISLAVAVSLIRAQLYNTTVTVQSPVVLPEVTEINEKEVIDEEALVEARMQRMFVEGVATTTSEQQERMQQMNEQTPDLTSQEQDALLERMRAMRDAP